VVAPVLARLKRLVRRIVHHRSYARMARCAAAGDYFRAAVLAWSLDERELMARYERLHRTKIALVKMAPAASSPIARRALEHAIRSRRN